MFRLLRDGLVVAARLLLPLAMVTIPFAFLYNGLSNLSFLPMASGGLALFWIAYGCSTLLIAKAGGVGDAEMPRRVKSAVCFATVLALVAIEGVVWAGFTVAGRLRPVNTPLFLMIQVILLPVLVLRLALVLSPAIALVHGCHPISCMKSSAAIIFGNASRFGALLIAHLAAWLPWHFVLQMPGGRDPLVVSSIGGLLWLLPVSIGGLLVVRSDSRSNPEVRLRTLHPSIVNASSVLVSAILGATTYALLSLLGSGRWPSLLHGPLAVLLPSTVSELLVGVLCGIGAGWVAARASLQVWPGTLAGFISGMLVLAHPRLVYDFAGPWITPEVIAGYAAHLFVFSAAGAIGGLLARRQMQSESGQP